MCPVELVDQGPHPRAPSMSHGPCEVLAVSFHLSGFWFPNPKPELFEMVKTFGPTLISAVRI